jgi:hypothetical protein
MQTIIKISYPVLALFAYAMLGVLPKAYATCQEGCLTTQNTALGDDALINSTGIKNTANGSLALLSNTRGDDNTATGYSALFNNTTGINNTAIGDPALFSNATGSGNIALGF